MPVKKKKKNQFSLLYVLVLSFYHYGTTMQNHVNSSRPDTGVYLGQKNGWNRTNGTPDESRDEKI